MIVATKQTAGWKIIDQGEPLILTWAVYRALHELGTHGARKTGGNTKAGKWIGWRSAEALGRHGLARRLDGIDHDIWIITAHGRTVLDTILAAEEAGRTDPAHPEEGTQHANS